MITLQHQITSAINKCQDKQDMPSCTVYKEINNLKKPQHLHYKFVLQLNAQLTLITYTLLSVFQHIHSFMSVL
jgi:hypothetical protein